VTSYFSQNMDWHMEVISQSGYIDVKLKFQNLMRNLRWNKHYKLSSHSILIMDRLQIFTSNTCLFSQNSEICFAVQRWWWCIKLRFNAQLSLPLPISYHVIFPTRLRTYTLSKKKSLLAYKKRERPENACVLKKKIVTRPKHTTAR
jgi:hypothetical protein